MSETVVEFFRYNAWANQVLLEACSELSNEELEYAMPGTAGTLRATLMHLVTSPESFINRIMGGDPGPPARREWPGVAGVAAIAKELDGALLALAEAFEASDTAETVNLTYMQETRSWPRRFFFVHAITHATEHRSQVCMMLTALGKPLDLDGWNYAAAMEFGTLVTTGNDDP